MLFILQDIWNFWLLVPAGNDFHSDALEFPET